MDGLDLSYIADGLRSLAAVPISTLTRFFGRRGGKVIRCADCRGHRLIRADSAAVRCASCATRRTSRKERPERKTGSWQCCARCEHRFWRYAYASYSRFCSMQCAGASRSKVDHQDRVRSRAIANNALRRGRLAPAPCLECGDTNAEMHHAAYSRPLDVDWLCNAHHTALHVARGDLKASP